MACIERELINGQERRKRQSGQMEHIFLDYQIRLEVLPIGYRRECKLATSQ